MADYPLLAATLGALDGTKNNPSDVEDASKLAAVDRQTRNWLYSFLTTLIDPSTNKLKDSAFEEGSVPVGGVRGSESNGPSATQREILQGTVSTEDLRDVAVATTKIVDLAVTTSKVAATAITEAKLATDAVSTNKIVNLAVTEGKLAAGAVTSGKLGAGAVGATALATGAVTTDKIGDAQVTGPKLLTGTSAQVILHNGTTWAATTLSGGISVSSTGVVTVNLTTSSVSYARVVERVASGTAGGASSAGSWTQARGVGTAWAIEEQTGTTTISLGASGLINFIANGLFSVTARAPGYSTGGHKTRMTYTPTSGPAVDYPGETACAGVGTITHSQVAFMISVTGASSGTPATVKLFHWTELAQPVNGLGLAATSGDVERYATVEFLRLAAA